MMVIKNNKRLLVIESEDKFGPSYDDHKLCLIYFMPTNWKLYLQRKFDVISIADGCVVDAKEGNYRFKLVIPNTDGEVDLKIKNNPLVKVVKRKVIRTSHFVDVDGAKGSVIPYKVFEYRMKLVHKATKYQPCFTLTRKGGKDLTFCFKLSFSNIMVFRSPRTNHYKSVDIDLKKSLSNSYSIFLGSRLYIYIVYQ